MSTATGSLSTGTVPTVGTAPRAWLRLAPSVFMLAWGGNHFTPLIAMYEGLGGYSAWQANLLLSTYVAGLVPGLLVAGPLSDRFGRRWVWLAGMICGLIASAMLAPGLHHYLLLCAGRVLAGVGVGVAMSVGTSWMKELSSAPFDTKASSTAGARRPSLTLTLGFGLGAGVTGLLAQWAPLPDVLPYLVHATLSAVALVLGLSVPETHRPGPIPSPEVERRRLIPLHHRSRFRGIVVPLAPWVFGAAGVAYAVLPAAVADRLGSYTTLYATLLTVLALGSGAVVQSFVPAIDARVRGGASWLGLALMTLGMGAAALASLTDSPFAAAAVAVLLGCAYGVCMVAGLLEIQRISHPDDLATLTGVYYSLAYAGFLLPTVLAILLPSIPYFESLAVVTGISALCLVIVIRTLRPRRHPAD